MAWTCERPVRPIHSCAELGLRMKKTDDKGHILVPEHEKLTEKEKEELLAKYAISLEELPRIRKSDAALVGMNVKSGDVIKITRNSPTAGEAIFYRVVQGA